jgi:hypothetical protein
MWYVSLFAFLIVVPHVLGLPLWFGPAIRQVVSLWSVVAATTAAALAMTVYLWNAHPRLRRQMAEPAG